MSCLASSLALGISTPRCFVRGLDAIRCIFAGPCLCETIVMVRTRWCRFVSCSNVLCCTSSSGGQQQQQQQQHYQQQAMPGMQMGGGQQMGLAAPPTQQEQMQLAQVWINKLRRAQQQERRGDEGFSLVTG